MPIKWFVNLFNKKSEESLEDHAELEKAAFLKEIKHKLQKLDELTTSAEMEIEMLSEELDKVTEQEDYVKNRIKDLNKPGSYLERNLLMRTQRLKTYGDTLKQRIEIYHQNIDLYINMIARIQDIQAMRMGGIDEEKISSVWLEFNEELEQYRERLVAATTADSSSYVTSETLEKQLRKLREDILPTRVKEEPTIKKEELKSVRPSIDQQLKASAFPESVANRELEYE